MKKLRILSLLPTILLSSCGKLNPAGTYQFRLGKTNDTHLEFTAVLTNEDHLSFSGAKKMTLTADLGDEMSPSVLIASYGEQYPILEPFIKIIQDEVENIKEIPMYYKVLDIEDPKYGYKLDIGTDFVSKTVGVLKEKYPVIKELLEAFSIPDSEFVITPDKSAYFFSAYVDSKTLTFQIPVSVEDFKMQLLWYGKSSLLPEGYIDDMPGEKGEKRFGTHPIVKTDDNYNVIYRDVDVVNKMYEKEFSNTHLYKDGIKIGSFSTDVIDGKTRLKLFLDSTYTGSHLNIEGSVKVKGLTGEYDEDKPIKISVDDSHIATVTHNGKTDSDEGFLDGNGNEFTFSKLMQKPFVFRDFNIVNVGLAKI